MRSVQEIAAGDTVIRMLAGTIPVTMKVHSVDDYFIYLGPPPHGWKFRRDTGAEVDEELGWDGLTITGSYLVP